MNIFTLLTVLFIGLKLTGFITWSWWLVLSPLAVGIALFMFFVTLALVIEVLK